MSRPQDGAKTAAMFGEFIGCAEKDCVKGTVFLWSPGTVATEPCEVCKGKGYLVLWRTMDLTRLRVAA